MRLPQGASPASVKLFKGLFEIDIALAMSVLPFLISDCLFEHLNDIRSYIHQSMVLQGARTWQIDGKLTNNASRPGSEHQHAVTERDRLAHIMRDKEDRLAGGRPDGLKLSMEPVSCQCIQRSEWFIHEQDSRIEGESACNGDT